MIILGIDYGKSKIGFAISESKIAEPYRVVKIKSMEDAIEKVKEVVSSFAKASEDKQVEQVEQVVIGDSEGRMAEETKEFGRKLGEKLNIPVIFQDETLTTQEAQRLSIEAGIKRKKRKALEDAYSAALILQAYLDNL
ncbi:hypothetical protein A3A76_05110 [Candidatus Woesebacteria bacterium RIFCSPLOWO2_01_FULL_39_23]|uniref:Putative pre-16S rRNA nuclease n=2 Tax=Microgenomates group TaxID=1794810 RepID=A0A0H4T795_9BACT|nr:Holliday junction resolvase YqgF, putative holliday junction resolvase [uncultured Microgenomates bacterium Rifle_16ft_4_minimus_37633]OGM13861.1 MAG: hypothetical protein A2141_04335 [Candidatus Woesebacteria bacterium RBG_16_40_11]OGM27813.1 MAG: hypothetical protein A2628_05330 [Candidatus Woesebacteria bacterium RIFCSPHIGHO2_01_FULL_40_22]OGM36077.1 MAG: hypothetical protein A3E41_04565 [Candidatus Woesebacteria bacterium RIFCSPHIGHO2_12_FULL_38_9]OGM62235.1 MAG: hypothetical protein A3A